jgi:hypothetical protein
MTNTFITFIDEAVTSLQHSDFDLKSKPKVRYNVPPLALVLLMTEKGLCNNEIVNQLALVNHELEELSKNVRPEHLSQADTIYKHFSMKYMLRRLKGSMRLSSWGEVVDEICTNQLEIEIDSIRALVTLPRFYNEDKQIEHLIKNYQTAGTEGEVLLNVEEQLSFVTKIQRRAKGKNHDDFYWSDSKNQLFRFRLPSSSLSVCAWDYFAQQKQINIVSEYVRITRIIGYGFTLLEPTILTKIGV